MLHSTRDKAREASKWLARQIGVITIDGLQLQLVDFRSTKLYSFVPFLFFCLAFSWSFILILVLAKRDSREESL